MNISNFHLFKHFDYMEQANRIYGGIQYAMTRIRDRQFQEWKLIQKKILYHF